MTLIPRMVALQVTTMNHAWKTTSRPQTMPINLPISWPSTTSWQTRRQWNSGTATSKTIRTSKSRLRTSKTPSRASSSQVWLPRLWRRTNNWTRRYSWMTSSMNLRWSCAWMRRTSLWMLWSYSLAQRSRSGQGVSRRPFKRLLATVCRVKSYNKAIRSMIP